LSQGAAKVSPNIGEFLRIFFNALNLNTVDRGIWLYVSACGYMWGILLLSVLSRHDPDVAPGHNWVFSTSHVHCSTILSTKLPFYTNKCEVMC
jgi:hypothetical protein